MRKEGEKTDRIIQEQASSQKEDGGALIIVSATGMVAKAREDRSH
jgi:hypothetical protein